MGKDNLSLPIPVLSGGISQQPAALRLPEQVQDASNADFRLYDGFSKRNGTKYAAKITGLSAAGDYRLHSIERDGDERYLVIYGEGVMRVFEVLDDGVLPLLLEATVTSNATATTYIGSVDGEYIRLVTVADHTIVTNRTIATGYSTSPDYTVSTVKGDAAILFSQTPAQDTYHQTLADAEEALKGYYKYNTGTQTFATYKGYTVSGSNYAQSNGLYNNPGNNPGGFRIGFVRLQMALATVTIAGAGPTYTVTETGAFTSYTLVAGDMIYITGGTGVTAGWATINSRDSADQLTVTPVGGTVLAACVDATTDGIGVEYEVEVNMDSDLGLTADDMDGVARVFQDALQKAGAREALIAWVPTTGASGYMLVTSPYKGAHAEVTAPRSPTAGYDYTLTTRPFSKVGGEYTLTNGTGGTTVNTQRIIDRWTRVAAPAQPKARIDTAKMPCKLVRSTYTGDGVTPATFAFDPITWDDRLSGDENSNPLPDFIDDQAKIEDVVFLENRLVIGSGEWVVFSQSDDLFNFFINNSTNLVDSDPISLPLSSTKVAKVSFLVPFRRAMVVFTFAGEHYSISADGPLTPSSAVSTPGPEHQCWSARPMPMDGRLYYTSERGAYAAVYEYFYDDLRVDNTAAMVTAHAPTLVPLDIKSIVTVRTENVIACLSRTAAYDHILYVHRSHWQGDRKIQSAWTKYVFDSSYRICDIAVIRNRIYMLVESASQYFIEYLGYEVDGQNDLSVTTGFTYLLDRQISLTGVHSAGTTTFTLPFTDNTLNAIVPTFTAGAAVTDTPVTPTSNAAGSVTITGDYSGGTCVLGRTFAMSVELTRPFIRDGAGQPVTSIEAIIKRLHIWHRRSGPYTVRMVQPGRSDYSESFTPPTGTIEPQGEFSARVTGNARANRVFIENSSIKPCVIASVRFDVDAAEGLR